MSFHQHVIDLFTDLSDENFNSLAMQLFHFQAEHNKVYNKYLHLIHCKHDDITNVDDIPLLPISLYKHLEIKTGDWKEEKIFLSSGTTQMVRSKSYVKNLSWYELISQKIFESSIGALNDYGIYGLLPSYTDNPNSSLIHMVEHFSKSSATAATPHVFSGFRGMESKISKDLERENSKVLLIGVTFALLDFADRHSINSPNLEIMFTGGMKNQKREMSYEDIHAHLSDAFPSSKIYAEYGMTELCAQAYSLHINRYQMNACLRVLPKEITDPLCAGKWGKTARLGLIDLSNIDTCAFILSDDLGRVFPHHFEIIGRLDFSDLRGCNMLYHSS